MKTHVPARLAGVLALAEIINAMAREMTKAVNQHRQARRPRVRRGATLRPGDDTPLWNALATHVQPTLKRRGAHALLARELGLHRARMGEFFKQRTAMPDAERTLRLLVWLSRQPAGSTTVRS